VRPLFQALYDNGVEVLLSGHDHIYERFAPQAPSGAIDLARGVREFVVGTGGKSLYTLGAPQPNSEARDGQTFGVLELTLYQQSYAWRFLSAPGGAVEDSQAQACNSPPHDTSRPSAPTGLHATPADATTVDLDWTAATDNLGAVRYEIYRDDALLASTTSAVTAYTDATASPSTTYSYTVRARDAAGNLSLADEPAAATTFPAGTVAFSAESDARVEEAGPEANFGASFLRADGGADPDVETYLRFDTSSFPGAIQAAKLRVYAYTGTADGPAVLGVTDPWSETGITWANRPPAATAPIDDKGAIAPNTWVEYDVTPLVTGPGTYSFVLRTTSNDGVDFYSREAANPPRLVLTAAVPTSGAAATSPSRRAARRPSVKPFYRTSGV
jgi:hypothetical protein